MITQNTKTPNKMQVMPTIVEVMPGGVEKYYDLPSKLFQNRIILLHGEIDEYTSMIINSQLLYLDSENNEDITILIESPGGLVTVGLSIMDTINRLNSKVITIASGEVASMGAFLLSCGTKTRKATKNCRIMLHHLSGGSQGTIMDMRIKHKESEFLHNKLTEILAKNTNKTFEEIDSALERDYWMSSEEALEFGLIDEII